MSFSVYLLEAFHAGMRVDLRRRDRRVPEQLLHRAKVGAGIEQVRGERVTQRMGAEPGVLV